MKNRNSRRLSASLFIAAAAAITAAGCGGGGGSSPGVPATATPQATTAAGQLTPPSSAGPSSATAQATYTSANPTITLPTVGMVASQLTLPPDLVPDGTKLSFSVSSGSGTAQIVRTGSARSARRALSIANSDWSVTISSQTNFAFDPNQTALTLAVGGSTPSNGGTMTYYAGNGSNYTVLGTSTADLPIGSTLIFDGASPCSTNASGSSGTNSYNVTETTSVSDDWNVQATQTSGRVRAAATTGASCSFTGGAAPPLATGDLYVSDPGQSAVLLFPAGASGNVEPYSPLASAPLIATDFAGELIADSQSGTYQDAEILPFGSSTIVDTIVSPGLGTAAQGVAADPVGAHVGLLGADLSGSSCAGEGSPQRTGSDCPTAINIFDRAQGGFAAPAVELTELNLGRFFFQLWLDQNDDAFTAGKVTSGQCGAVEYAPDFGVFGGVTGPFAIFPTSDCGVDQVTTDAAGNVYVAVPSTGVLVFAPGTTVTEATLPSSALPNNQGPSGVAVDAQGDVYVSSPQIVGSDGSTVVTQAAIVVFSPFANWSSSPTPIRTISGASTGLVSPGKLAVVNTSPSSPPNETIALSPTTVTFTATGQSQNVGVSENGYTGSFAQSNSCGGVATIAAASGGFSVSAQGAGTCFATISDAGGNSAKLGVTVTTTSFSVSSRHSRQ